MKTTTKIFAALAVLLCTMALTSCERAAQIVDELKSEVVGPKDTWCAYTYESNGVTIYAYALYSEDGYNLGSGYKKESLPAGLTLVMVPKAGDSSKLADLGFSSTSSYIVKTFEKGKKITAEGGDSEGDSSSKGLTVNQAGWTIMYQGVGFEKSRVPAILDNSVTATEITDADSIKKAIKLILLSKITDKLL